MPDYAFLQPIKIGPATMKNRISMTAIIRNFCEDGFINDDYIAYYAERAKGGAGLVSRVESLAPQERVEEIARMLAGAKVTEEARAAAGKLLSEVS